MHENLLKHIFNWTFLKCKKATKTENKSTHLNMIEIEIDWTVNVFMMRDGEAREKDRWMHGHHHQIQNNAKHNITGRKTDTHIHLNNNTLIHKQDTFQIQK